MTKLIKLMISGKSYPGILLILAADYSIPVKETGRRVYAILSGPPLIALSNPLIELIHHQ